jgi:amino acid permease
MFLLQDTVKSPPAENKTMKKASFIGVVVTTMFYISVGCAGYAAFGDHAPGNLLTGFGFYNPFWLVDIANICIVIHLVGAYQVLILHSHHYNYNNFRLKNTKTQFIVKIQY